MASGKSSRAKGVSGERESADVFRRYGFEIVRLQNNVLDAGDFVATLYGQKRIGLDFAPVIDVPTIALLVDAKRRERLNIAEAAKQVEAVAREGQVPCVAWRRNREPWRGTLLLEDLARLLGTP